MSWKGFQKGIVRAPQHLLHKVNHAPKDPMFLDVQQRFDDIETQIKRLHTECKRYWEAIGRLLYHQIEYSKIIEQLYQPNTGRYILAEGEQAEDPSADLEGAAAAEQYRNLNTELQSLIQPELEMIETRILKPADDLLNIINAVKKMLTKREHKHLDLERQSQALKKIQDREERSVKQEEKMYKVENDYEIAMEEYNYYNELLKEELPRLFKLEGNFIKPLFQSFYFMQLNIYYTLYCHMEEMKTTRFDLHSDILGSFRTQFADVNSRIESISLTHFKQAQPQQKLDTLRRKRSQRGETDSPSSFGSMSPTSPPLSGRSRKSSGASFDVPPPLHNDFEEGPQPPRPRRPTRKPVPEPVDETESPPPPPARPQRPKPAAPPTEFCRALYDFDAQNEGDVSFRVGDRIEIVRRTPKQEGWWTGIVNGQQGTFPGNYVELE